MPRTVLITGSTSGIGWGIAKAFAEREDRVVLNGFPGDVSAQDLCAEIAALGGQAMYHAADMRKPDQIQQCVQEACQEFGGIDILVNNAGIQHVCAVEDFPLEKWEDILAVNLSSVFHTTRQCVPLMKKAGWGRIVNIASAHGLVASAYKSAYVAAKHGVLGLSKSVALELAEHHITCNAICPGYVRTPLVEAQIPAQAHTRGISENEVIQEVMLKNQPTREFVTIEEVASLVIYLCEQEARNITGAALSIDGGWVAQ